MKVREAMHKGVQWVGPDTPIERTRETDAHA